MDIAITQDSNGQFDIVPQGADLAPDHGLRTAVIISLFTDRRAANDDILPDDAQGSASVAGGRTPGATNDRRGWWANPELGSRLWLLSREKQTTEVLNRAREYALEALQWLLDDGVATSVEVTTEWHQQQPGTLAIGVVITNAQGSPYTETFSYSLESN